jgi:hypothetical protein
VGSWRPDGCYLLAISIPATSRTSDHRGCRSCLDRNKRRAHLAGSLGEALLSSFFDNGCARPTAESRSILFSAEDDRQSLHSPADLAAEPIQEGGIKQIKTHYPPLTRSIEDMQSTRYQ